MNDVALETTPDPYRQLRAALAAKPVDWRTVARLIHEGVIDVTDNPKRVSESRWPLVWNVAQGPYELLEKCVASGMPVRPHAHPQVVIEQGIHSGIAKNVRLLIKHGALVGGLAKPFGHIHHWCIGNEEGLWANFDGQQWNLMLDLIIEAGADINQYDQWGRTALLLCLLFHSGVSDPDGSPIGTDPKNTEYLDRAMMLIAAGANVNLPLTGKSFEIGGRWPKAATPLFARPYGDGKLHLALLKAGADPLIRCTKPVAWNAIEFAELALTRLTGVPPPIDSLAASRASAEYGKDPLPDDPKVIERVIAAMKKAATK